jgi:hypothetical protein
MTTTTAFRALRSTGLLLIALSAFSSVAGAAPSARGDGLTLTIRKLPASRATMGELAAYYYGAREMSFVIQSANPWLRSFSPARRLVTAPGLGAHPTILVPAIRGARPIDPGAGAAAV